ncbi:hypothetical protein SAMN04487890_10757 [Mucilaginibacter polytrichastri]|nr:hypothetical protein SAMN04487890_10757 [Mucilaginibacter polytrichastri]
MKSNKIIDITTHTILGVFIMFSFYYHFSSNIFFSINNYLAIFCWVVSLFFILYKRTYPFVLLELLLSLFNIINFNSTVYKFGFVLGVGIVRYEPISMNPIILVLFIGYVIFNRNFIIFLLDTLLNGTEEDRIKSREKSINFYRDKFSNWGDFELNRALTIIKEYPEEAQFVIREIENERK